MLGQWVRLDEGFPNSLVQIIQNHFQWLSRCWEEIFKHLKLVALFAQRPDTGYGQGRPHILYTALSSQEMNIILQLFLSQITAWS